MQGLHGNQKKILEYLMDHKDGATLEQIAEHLLVTKTAAKDHLLKIDGLGLLTYIDTKGLIGRPRRRYLLSESGQEQFPKQYSWLSQVLLELLADDLGSEEISRMMKRLAHKVSDSMMERFENTSSMAERLAEVSQALTELGYRASLKQSDLRKGAVIEATNCVYHSVAKSHPELCKFDVQFIQDATGGLDVKLESCIARGGSVCRFCIRKR